MGKLQITKAEIKNRFLRVCHVKMTRIYTVSHVKNPYLTCLSCALHFSTCRLQYTLVTELPAIVASHRSASELWTNKEGCTTLIYTVSCVAVAVSPTRRSLLTETANREQLLMVAAVLQVVLGRLYGLILATVCGLDYWFACYHIHSYVALSVIDHRMCNRISGLCDKSSITIDTKRYRETSLVCYLRYYYSCLSLCTMVILLYYFWQIKMVLAN